ncbi:MULTISPECIES: GTP-binding protein [Streptomyces]|uniref:GTP-binding protein n=1 Tax=Streptomyces TaxID=1883 RepID=UPI00099D14AC|nr:MULTISPECIES: GTP-binding protein [Streptomyces]RZF09400.1 elongation factor Tu [Streptomyces albidoflavus]
MKKITRRAALRYGLTGIAAIGSTAVLPAAAKAPAAVRKEVLPSERARPVVGTIGHAGHGKTTLASALTTVLARKYGGAARSVDQITAAPAEEVDGIPIRASHVEYATPARGYTHVDCASHIDCAKNMIMGTRRLDAAILVVSAAEGPMPETREQILLARQAGVGHILVFLSKCDLVDDPELLDLVEMEIRDLLSQYDFPGDDTPIVRGSALKALEGADAVWEGSVIELARHLDHYIPDPERPVDKPFLMPVESVASPAGGDAVVVTGASEYGTLNTGDEVEIVGGEERVGATCTGIEKSGQVSDSVRSGESCRAALRGVRPEQVGRGLALARPGSFAAHTRFEAEVYFPSQEEGGRSTLVPNGYSALFHIYTAEVTGSVELPEGAEGSQTGCHIGVKAALRRPVAMGDGTRFTIRENGRAVGFGVLRIRP